MTARLPGPVPAFNFYVALYDAGGGVLSAAQAAAGSLFMGFSEVSGLNAESEIEEYREGGSNAAPRKFVKWGKYPNLVFKRGVSFSPTLWDWHYRTLSGGGAPLRKSGIIILTDRAGVPGTEAAAPGLGVPLPVLDRMPVAAWSFRDGLPEKMQGPGLNAKGNEVAIETLEIAHEGLIRMSAQQVPGVGSFVTSVLGRIGV
jgi:phage tail-like protein